MALQHPLFSDRRDPLRKEGAMMRDVGCNDNLSFWRPLLEHQLHPAIDSFSSQAVSDRWEGLRDILALRLSNLQTVFPDKVGDIFKYLMVLVPYLIGRHLGVQVPTADMEREFNLIESTWDSESLKRLVGERTRDQVGELSRLTEAIVKLFPQPGQPATRPTQPQRSYQSKGRRA